MIAEVHRELHRQEEFTTDAPASSQGTAKA
jgi:hypothetical protein